VRLNTEGIFIKVSGVTLRTTRCSPSASGERRSFDFGPTPRQISVNAATILFADFPSARSPWASFVTRCPSASWRSPTPWTFSGANRRRRGE